jgi:hypothetical protein
MARQSNVVQLVVVVLRLPRRNPCDRRSSSPRSRVLGDCVRSSGTRGFSASYGAGSGVGWNAAVMGARRRRTASSAAAPESAPWCAASRRCCTCAVHLVALDVYGEITKAGRAVRIHVVGTVLRVVFQNENRRAGPEFRFRNPSTIMPSACRCRRPWKAGRALPGLPRRKCDRCRAAASPSVAAWRRISRNPPGRPGKPLARSTSG